MARTQPKNSQLRNVSIQLCARESQRALIDRAAHAVGKNRSDFLLEAACREAESVLLDQRLFTLSEEDFQRFVQALEAPPSNNEKLKKLLFQKAPWN